MQFGGKDTKKISSVQIFFTFFHFFSDFLLSANHSLHKKTLPASQNLQGERKNKGHITDPDPS